MIQVCDALQHTELTAAWNHPRVKDIGNPDKGISAGMHLELWPVAEVIQGLGSLKATEKVRA